jgi:hypothetical protein
MERKGCSPMTMIPAPESAPFRSSALAAMMPPATWTRSWFEVEKGRNKESASTLRSQRERN